MGQEKRKQVVKISIFITSIFVIFLSISYAFINQTIFGTKKQTITSGYLSIEFEEENEINIKDAMPMYDEIGMIQEAFVFRLKNESTHSLIYSITLEDITKEEANKLDASIIKYGLTKGDNKIIDFVSNLKNYELDGGIIKKQQTIEYSLRLWIDSEVKENATIFGKELSYRINLRADQNQNEEIEYHLSSDKLEMNNQITVQSNQREIIEIEFAAISKKETKYQMYYIGADSENIDVKYLASSESKPVGNVPGQEVKTIRIVAENRSKEPQTITLGIKGKLTTDEEEIQLEETAIPITEILTPKYQVTGDKLNTSKQITVAANSNQKIKLQVTSLEDEITKYQAYFKGTNLSGIAVKYLDTTASLPTDNIEANGTKTISLLIQNTSSVAKTVTLDVKGIFLINGEKIQLETGEQPITSTIKESSLLSYKITSTALDSNNQSTFSRPNYEDSITNDSFEADVTITSLNDIDSVYQIYYKFVNSSYYTGDLDIQYVNPVKDLPYGTIKAGESKTIRLVFRNNTNYLPSRMQVGVRGELANKKVEEIQMNSGEYRVNKKYTYPILKDVVKQGDYVEYIGNNGCKNTHDKNMNLVSGNVESTFSCHGYNANAYSRDPALLFHRGAGYCSSSTEKFSHSGWRVAYVENNHVYLIAAGAPECYSLTASANNATYINEANEKAKKYCNSNFVDGDCSNNNDSWAFNNTDFTKITKTMNNGTGYNLLPRYGSPSCRDTSSAACGLGNELIDAGGWYYFAATSNNGSEVHWDPTAKVVTVGTKTASYGLRPIIRLSSSVYVTGGVGSDENRYKIAN